VTTVPDDNPDDNTNDNPDDNIKWHHLQMTALITTLGDYNSRWQHQVRTISDDNTK
jgi:hypothetical protein